MKFSIVTPAYNSGRWLEETIQSVISQAGDFEIEYIIRDGGSTDDTVAIIKKYEGELKSGAYPIRCNRVVLTWRSEKDGGMYDAINKGFRDATGNIYAWLNSDDLYEEGALAVMAKAFSAYSDIEWLKGISTPVEEGGSIARKGRCLIYDQEWLKMGVYGRESYFVEQDSVFWRSSLWGKGGPMPPQYRLAGDYWLWISFAKYAPLWALNARVSKFRKVQGQLSSQIGKYKAEQKQIRPSRPLSAWLPRLFFTPQSRLAPRFAGLFLWLYPLIFMRKPMSYLEVIGGQIEKRHASSYVIH